MRPSDNKKLKKVAWIQCVGSRQVIPGGNSYCSAVCCTYTQKQVILTKDHDAEAKATVFHNDIRSFGKDFERFYQRAENLPGVRFIRSYVSIGEEIPESKNVSVRYSTPEDGVKEEEFDMVVPLLLMSKATAERFLLTTAFVKSMPLSSDITVNCPFSKMAICQPRAKIRHRDLVSSEKCLKHHHLMVNVDGLFSQVLIKNGGIQMN